MSHIQLSSFEEYILDLIQENENNPQFNIEVAIMSDGYSLPQFLDTWKLLSKKNLVKTQSSLSDAYTLTPLGKAILTKKTSETNTKTNTSTNNPIKLAKALADKTNPNHQKAVAITILLGLFISTTAIIIPLFTTSGDRIYQSEVGSGTIADMGDGDIGMQNEHIVSYKTDNEPYDDSSVEPLDNLTQYDEEITVSYNSGELYIPQQEMIPIPPMTMAEEGLSLGSIFYYSAWDGDWQIAIGTEISFTTVDTRFEVVGGQTAIVIPIMLTNLGNESRWFNSLYTLYGPDGHRINDDGRIRSAFDTKHFSSTRNSMRPGATLHSHIYVLFVGNGDYFIELGFGESAIEVRIPVHF